MLIRWIRKKKFYFLRIIVNWTMLIRLIIARRWKRIREKNERNWKSRLKDENRRWKLKIGIENLWFRDKIMW